MTDHRPTERTATDPDDEVVDCPYCDRRFRRASYRDLHLGVDHGDCLSADERASYETALADETQALRMFRLKALAALVVLYFGFLVVYAFSL